VSRIWHATRAEKLPVPVVKLFSIIVQCASRYFFQAPSATSTLLAAAAKAEAEKPLSPLAAVRRLLLCALTYFTSYCSNACSSPGRQVEYSAFDCLYASHAPMTSGSEDRSVHAG